MKTNLRTKLILLLCWSMLMPLILKAQPSVPTPPITVSIEIYSTLGASWDGSLQAYLSYAAVGTTYKGNQIREGGRQFGPNDFSPHGVLFIQQNIIPGGLGTPPPLQTWDFPVSMTLKMEEIIVNGIIPSDITRENFIALTKNTPPSGSFVMSKFAPTGTFLNGGYIFNYNFGIPQVPVGRFGAYDNTVRTMGRTKFCPEETMYVDTYFNPFYNGLAHPINNARFMWEYTVDGAPPKYFISGSNTGALTIPVNSIPLPDPTKANNAHLRVAMVGPSVFHDFVFDDGLQGPWSAPFDFTIYPTPPQLSITQTPTISTVAELTESTDPSFVVKHIACKGDPKGGEVLITKLNQTSGYLIAVKNNDTGEVMNFTANWSPSAANPIRLPQDAIDGKGPSGGIFPFRAGHYNIKVQSINPEDFLHRPFACFSDLNFIIKEPDALNVSLSKADVSCAENFPTTVPTKDGKLIATPTGGLAPYDYTLIFNDGASNVTRNSNDQAGAGSFTGLAPYIDATTSQIQYNITAKDDAGCPANVIGSNLTLNVPPAIRIATVDTGPGLNGGFNIRCFGGKDDIEVDITGGADMFSAWLDGPAGTNYQLRNNINVPEDQLKFTDLVAGNYTAVAVDQNNCRFEFPFTFTSPTKLDIESSLITPATCFDGSDGAIKFNAKGGVPFPGVERYEYTLNTNPASTIFPMQSGEDATFTDLRRTSYLMKIADSFGCTQFYPLSVGSPPELNVVTVATDVACFGTTSGSSKVTFSGGVEPYTLDWLDGSRNNITTVTSATAGNNTLSNRNGGQYYALITDANGCKKESLSTISAPSAALDLAAGALDILSATCNGMNDGQVTLTANGGWSTYLFSKGGSFQANNTFDALAPGSYTFTVKDARGCTDSFDATITEPEPLTVAAHDLKAVSCFGDSNGAFTPDIAGGTGPYSVYDATLGWISAMRVEGLPTGNYHLMVRDSRQCTTSADILIPTPAKLLASVQSVVDTKCNEANGSAQVNVSGGTLPYSAKWDLDGNVISTDVNPTSLPAGIYDVFILDANECSVPLTAAISSSDGAVIDIQSTTPVTCSDGDDGTAIVTVSGGTLPYVTIEWTNGETGLGATTLLKGANFISVEDNVGCVVTKQVDIGGPDAIVGNFTAISPKCFGDMDGSLVVEASGGIGPYEYLWANTTNNTTEINAIGGGDYSVSITDSKGCNAISDYTLSQPDPVVVELSGAEVLCTGQTSTLDAGNPGSTYSWTATNGFTSTERVITVSQAGVYTVLVTDPQGCKGTDEFELGVDDNLLQADFLAASEAIVGDTVVLINITFPAPDSTYWSFPDGGDVVQTTYYTQEVVFGQAGDYSAVLYATLGGCEDNYEGTIHVIEELPDDEGSDDNGRKSSLVKSFNIHPNPTNGRFMVSVDLSEERNVMLDIISMKAVSTQARYSDYGKTYYELDVSLDVSPGLYTVMLKVGSETLTKRIIIY